MRSERRLPPRRGGYPTLHPQPSSLFRDGWRDEARGNVALPPPPSPPPHPKAPQAPSPPQAIATATAHLGASAARPSRFLLSPLSSKSGPSAFPPCSPEPFPTSSPLIGHDVPPSAPQNHGTRSSLPNGWVPPHFVYRHPSLGWGGEQNPATSSFPGTVRPVGSHLRGEEPPPVTGGVERTGSR